MLMKAGKFKMALQAGLILFFVFVVLLIVGMPIAISIAVSSIATLLLVVPFEIAVFTSAQKMVSSLNSFSLVAIPFFVLSGIIMNNGGIAESWSTSRCCSWDASLEAWPIQMFWGMPCSVSMSSSAIAASTAIGGVLIPQQIKSGYDRKFRYSGEYRVRSYRDGHPAEYRIHHVFVGRRRRIYFLTVLGRIFGRGSLEFGDHAGCLRPRQET